MSMSEGDIEDLLESLPERSLVTLWVLVVSAGWSPVSLRHCGGRADDCPHCPRSSCHQSLVLLSRPGGRPGVGAALSTPALTALRVTTRARQTHILMFFILWDWHLFDCPITHCHNCLLGGRNSRETFWLHQLKGYSTNNLQLAFLNKAGKWVWKNFILTKWQYFV